MTSSAQTRAWAGLAMILRGVLFSSFLTLTTRFDPISWHAHMFVLDDLDAVIAGFGACVVIYATLPTTPKLTGS